MSCPQAAAACRLMVPAAALDAITGAFIPLVMRAAGDKPLSGHASAAVDGPAQFLPAPLSAGR
jgi:hypothetical protein